MSYSGTQEIERILRVSRGKITIGVDPSETNLGTSEIRLTIIDADNFINSQLSDTIDTLPVTPTPEGLNFASKYLAAYLVHTMLFAANKPAGQADVVASWREMADKNIESYKNNVTTAGKPAKWTETTVVFTQRGVSGVSYQGADGIIDDVDIRDKQ